MQQCRMFSQGGGCFFEIVPHALRGTRCVDDIPLALNPPQGEGRLCTVRQRRTCSKCNLRRCFHVPARFRFVLRGSFTCVGPSSHFFSKSFGFPSRFQLRLRFIFHVRTVVMAPLSSVGFCAAVPQRPSIPVNNTFIHFEPFSSALLSAPHVHLSWRIDKRTDQSRPHELERKLLSTTGHRMSVRVPVKPSICFERVVVSWFLLRIVDRQE